VFSNSHKKLRVWQHAIKLVVHVYATQRAFPKYELYALCDQLRRAVVSIPSNIAEGNARQHERERKQFFHVALGSLAEVESLLEVACQLEYITEEELSTLELMCSDVGKMLSGLAGVNFQSSTINHRPSTIGTDSTIDHRPSTIGAD